MFIVPSYFHPKYISPFDLLKMKQFRVEGTVAAFLTDSHALTLFCGRLDRIGSGVGSAGMRRY